MTALAFDAGQAWEDAMYADALFERTEMDWARDLAEQEWASDWCEAWDTLEEMGVLTHKDRDITLQEMRRILAYTEDKRVTIEHPHRTLKRGTW